jgi:hypothetical protein
MAVQWTHDDGLHAYLLSTDLRSDGIHSCRGPATGYEDAAPNGMPVSVVGPARSVDVVRGFRIAQQGEPFRTSVGQRIDAAKPTV